MKRFEGKSVVVTGASRGLGRGIAQAFAAEGAQVFACYKSDELSAADVVAFPFLKYAVIWEDGDEHRFHEVLRDAQPLDGQYPRLEAWIHRIDALPRA